MTTAITITGKTFNHRETLKSYGAKYNGISREWTLRRANEGTIAAIKALPGVIVREHGAPTAPPMPNTVTSLNPASGVYETTVIEPSAPVVKVGQTVMIGNCSRWLNHFKNRDPIVHFGFDSLGDLVEYVKATEAHNRSMDAWSTSGDARYFTGTKSMPEAMELATNGWTEGADEITKIIEQINIDRPKARKRTHGVTGGHVNVGRLLTGHPLHMVRRPKQPHNKVVTLFLESGARADIEAQSMLLRAACAGAIVDRMEANGYSCEIVVCSNTEQEYNKTPWTFTCTVKRASERLNINALAFALGHPSFHRRFRFACVESRSELRAWHNSQGRSTEAFDRSHPTRPNAEFYIPRIQENYNTIGKTMRAVLPAGLPIKFEEIDK